MDLVMAFFFSLFFKEQLVTFRVFFGGVKREVKKRLLRVCSTSLFFIYHLGEYHMGLVISSGNVL